MINVTISDHRFSVTLSVNVKLEEKNYLVFYPLESREVEMDAKELDGLVGLLVILDVLLLE